MNKNYYEPIPFTFHRLAEPLAVVPDYVIEAALGWYKKEESRGLFTYRGGKLVKNIFPNFSAELEAKLVALVQTGEEESINFVMSLMRAYEGQSFLQNTCREIIKTLPADSPHWSEVAIILESSGVVSGEYGFVELYKRRKEEIAGWLNDPDPKVQSFAQYYSDMLEKQALSEKRRVEQEIEMRKHIYGEEPDEASDVE